MPQSLTIRDKKTGRMAKVNWHSSSPPTKEDIDQIFQEQGDRSREAVDKVANQPLNLSPTERFMQNHPGISKGVEAVNNFLPKTEIANPVAIVGSALEGGSRLLRGHGFSQPLVDPSIAPNLERERVTPTEHPRLSGLNMLGESAMRAGAYAVPSAALSAPLGTALGLGGGIALGTGARALVPQSAPPEYKEAAALAGGIVGGFAGGGVGSKIQGLLSPKSLVPVSQAASPVMRPPPSEPLSLSSGREIPRLNAGAPQARIGEPSAVTPPSVISAPGRIQPNHLSTIKTPVPPETAYPNPIADKLQELQKNVLPSDASEPAVNPSITDPAIPEQVPTEQAQAQVSAPQIQPPVSQALQTKLRSPNDISGFKGEPIKSPSAFANKNKPLEDMNVGIEPDPQPEPAAPETARQVREKKYDDYFSSMTALDDPKTHDVSVPWVVGKAKELGRSPSEAEEDLKISDVPQDKIDAAIKQHYPNPIEDEIDSFEDITDC